MTRSYSVAIPTEVHTEALAHLLRDDGQEDLCFAVWHPSDGRSRASALVRRLVLPNEGDRNVHGNASFTHTYFEAALGEAISEGGGLAFLHSHLGPGWQDMSPDDIRAENGHAAAAKGATGLPLVGLTLGTDGAWSGRFWEKTAPRRYERKWCSNVRVVGDVFQVTFADHLVPQPEFKEALKRTRSAWGDSVQANLARLRVGVVGAGSVGSIVAEGLARTGVAHVTLIDFDTIEVVNLDRTLHATLSSVKQRESKVACLSRGIRASATADGFTVAEVEYSIAEQEGYRAALDCDVLVSCVDRPWARHVLNFIAYSHLIPVADAGIQVEVTKRGLLKRADWKAHIVGPDHRCLECLEQFNAGLVQAEREGWLDDPEYIRGLPEDHPMKRNENVIAFSLSAASFELLQLLMMIVAPLGISDVGQQRYHFVPGLLDRVRFDLCKVGCPYPALIARGEHAGFVVTAKHKKAEDARLDRAKHTSKPKSIGFLSRLLRAFRSK